VTGRQKAAGRATTWRPSPSPEAAAGARPGFLDAGSELARRAADCVRRWALAEVSAGRLVPWIAIAFGCGIIVYFAIDQEPAVWAAVLLVCIAVSISVFARRRFVVFAAAAAFAAARLSPPLGPLRPGGYDFARDMYFQYVAANEINWLSFISFAL
jgi:competence protein ComEC